MRTEDIHALAREAGFTREDHHAIDYMLLRFAALIAAAEREACAQVAEWEPCLTHTSQRIAAAIRARSLG